MMKCFVCIGMLLLLHGQLSGQKPAPKIQVKKCILPVLVNRTDNPVMIIKYNSGTQFRLHSFIFDFSGTEFQDEVVALRVFEKRTGTFDTTKCIGESLNPPNYCKVTVNQNYTDSASFWISLELNPKTNLLHKFQVNCTGIETNTGMTNISSVDSQPKIRSGFALRKHMDDRVDTYRIPGLATSAKGTLLAIYDARRESARDLQGDIDIVLNRSEDGGNTWNSMQIVLDQKKWGGLSEKFNGVSDANILVDKRTTSIYVAGLWMHGVLDTLGRPIPDLKEVSNEWNHQWRDKGSQPGYNIRETSQFLITKSSDDGLTWSEPINLTNLKDSTWWLWAPSPGHGISLEDGTLVIPTQGRDANGRAFSNITWSKDDGKSWHISKKATSETSECMAVQLADGGLMLNSRTRVNKNDPNKPNGRAVAVTYDLGETWEKHPTSGNTLIEPGCMACIHRHNYQENGKSKHILLFSNPNSEIGRVNMTIKVSTDGGKTWPMSKWILLDELKGRGYSCLTSINEQTIGIIYESSQADIVFQKLSVSDFQ